MSREFCAKVLWSLALAVCVSTLSSCAIFSGNSSTSLLLPELAAKGDKNLSSQTPVELSKISDEPILYRLINNRSPAQNTPARFVTLLKECSDASRKRPAALASTRQLLVGLKQIQFRSKETLEVESHAVLYSNIGAKLDDNQVSLSTLSFQKDSCSFDLVVWSHGEEQRRLEDAELATLKLYVANLMEQPT